MDELEAELQKAEQAQAARKQSAKDLEDELTLGQAATQAPKGRGWFADVGASAVTGVAKAVTSTIDGIASLGDAITEKHGDVGLHIGSDGVSVYHRSPEEVQEYNATHENPLTAPTRTVEDSLGAPVTKTGGFVQATTQFLTGLLGTKKVFKGLELLQGTGKTVTAARNLIEGAIASGAAFEAHDGNLANLIESSKELGGPDLHNAITNALATHGDDSELFGRVKNMVTDAGFGVLADGLVSGLRAVKQGRQVRQAVLEDIQAEAAGNKVDVDVEREINFADEVPATEIRSPKTGEIVEVSKDSPAVDLKLSIPPFNGRTALSLETPEQAVARLGEDVASPAEAHVEQLQAVSEQATQVAENARQAVEDSKPATPFGDMSEAEAHDALRAELGITDEKLAQIRADVEAGKIDKNDVADLLGFNPSKFNWTHVEDAESAIGLMNSFTKVFADALGKAGSGHVSLKTIFAQANRIGGDVNAAISWSKRLQGVEAGLLAQRMTVAASGAHLDRLARKIAAAQHSPQDLLDFVVHERRHALLQTVAIGNRSQIGRALRVMREGVTVRESSLKIANGRRMRAERKAREISTKANEAASAAKEAAAKRESVKTARKAAADAKAKHAEAQTKAAQSEQDMADAARKFLDQAHKERLLSEQREANRAAREAVKQAEREAKQAEESARRAEAELQRHAKKMDKRFGNNEANAEVTLSGDTKLQFDEVSATLRNMGLDPDHVVDLAKEIAKREKSIQREAAARLGVAMKLQDRVTFLYINNILSGMPTMAMNVYSGFSKMIESTFEHYGAGALAKARGDKYAMVAANKAALATWTSWRAAWKLAGTAWKEGIPQTDILAKAEVEIRGGAGATSTEKVIGAPSRAIVTIDEFFKHIFYQQELNARAVEIAASAAQLQKGSGQKAMFDKVLKETLENPPDDVILDSIEKARYQTFQSNLNSKFSNNLIRLTNETPLLKLVVPFVKTPTNIIKQGIERTPLGLLNKSMWTELRAGTREGNMAAVRVALGTALVGTIWNMADEGTITGARAGSGSNANTGDIENIPPYSKKIGDTWYQYNRLDPFGTIIGLTADLRLYMKDREQREANSLESDDPTATEAFGNILAILNKNLLDKTFFKGISDFTTAVSEGRAGGSFMESYVQTVGTNLVPYSSFIRNIAKSHDDYAREAFSFSDKLLAQLPGYSKDLPPQRDVLGRPLPNSDRLGPDWVSPFLLGQNDPDPVAQELAKLHMSYRKPDKDIAGVPLSAQQYSRLTQVRGEFLYNKLKERIDSGEWARLNKAKRIEFVRLANTLGNRTAEATVTEEWADLGRHVRSLKAEARSIRSGDIEQ